MYFTVLNDEQSYNEFVSKRINNSSSENKIQFKVIHLKSKTNKKETFDATEELHNLTNDNGVSTIGFEKRRARSLFSTSTEQSTSRIINRRAIQKFNQKSFLQQQQQQLLKEKKKN